MKRRSWIRSVGLLVVLVISAVVLGGLWWRAWMYEGLPGLPWVGALPFLDRFVWLDGERSYDATLIQMISVVFLTEVALVVVIGRLRVRNHSSD